LLQHYDKSFLCSFEAADLDDVFKTNVKKSKYEKPTPVQKWAIPAIMKGRDIMGCAQTGSGKTVSSVIVAVWAHMAVSLPHLMIVF